MIQHDDYPFDLLPPRGQESGPDDDGDHDRGEDNQCEHRTGGAASSAEELGEPVAPEPWARLLCVDPITSATVVASPGSDPHRFPPSTPRMMGTAR
jgi:hypothetical protein